MLLGRVDRSYVARTRVLGSPLRQVLPVRRVSALTGWRCVPLPTEARPESAGRSWEDRSWVVYFVHG